MVKAPFINFQRFYVYVKQLVSEKTGVATKIKSVNTKISEYC